MHGVVDKDELLERLRTNREEHSGIVAEARKGYVEQARKALEAKLAELADGKVVALHFTLAVPEDHTREYDQVVAMMEMHQGGQVGLTQTQFARYVLDQWEWMSRFLLNSSPYSAMAVAKLGGE